MGAEHFAIHYKIWGSGGGSKILRVQMKPNTKLSRSTNFEQILARCMPLVGDMRPSQSWALVAAALTERTGENWTARRLRLSVKRLVKAGLADERLLAKAGRPHSARDIELQDIIHKLVDDEPAISLRAIARRLEAQGVPTPTGKSKWRATSINRILAKRTKNSS